MKMKEKAEYQHCRTAVAASSLVLRIVILISMILLYQMRYRFPTSRHAQEMKRYYVKKLYFQCTHLPEMGFSKSVPP